jgi:hypothetical protein
VEPPPDGLDIHRLEANGWPCENNPSGHAGLGCGTARAWKNLVGPVLPMHGYEATAKISLFLEKLCPLVLVILRCAAFALTFSFAAGISTMRLGAGPTIW